MQGWIDSSAAALILAEANGLAVGIVPRKIVIGGGESEYCLLAISDGRHVTLVDTSIFPFPDSFHPSGVLKVSLEDVNADSLPEVLLEAETIVSLRYLGATPVRWKAWLRRREGTLIPIFRYNMGFGSDYRLLVHRHRPCLRLRRERHARHGPRGHRLHAGFGPGRVSHLDRELLSVERKRVQEGHATGPSRRSAPSPPTRRRSSPMPTRRAQ